MIERAQADVHPPLYYILLKPWTGLFGDSVAAMRLLSVAWFGVSLVGAFLLCREASARFRGAHPAEAGRSSDCDRDAGLIAMLLMATSPFLFRYCQEARMYTQMIGLSTLSWWLLLRAFREQARPAVWWSAYGLAAVGLAYTHYFGLFSIASQVIFLVGLLLATSGLPGLCPWRSHSVCRALLAALLATTLYLPWVPTLQRQQRQVSTDYWAQTVDLDSPTSLEFWRNITLACLVHNRVDQATPFTDNEGLMHNVGYGLMAATGLILALLAWRWDRGGWCLVAGIVIPIILAILQCFRANRNIIGHRYLMPSYVLLLVGFALVLCQVYPRGLRWLLAIMACLNMAFLTFQYQKSLNLPGRAGFRGGADYIAAHRSPGDMVLCLDPLDYFPLRYHARDRFAIYQARHPDLIIKHFNGGPVFKAEDFRDWREVVKTFGHRVWILRGGSNAFPRGKPDDWERLEKLHFDEAVPFRGSLLLELWGATASATGPTGPISDRAPH